MDIRLFNQNIDLFIDLLLAIVIFVSLWELIILDLNYGFIQTEKPGSRKWQLKLSTWIHSQLQNIDSRYASVLEERIS